MPRRLTVAFHALLLFVGCAGEASAAETLPGEAMGWPWALPFVAVLLSIALGPLCMPRLWHRHYGKIGALWAAITVLAIAFAFGPEAAAASFVHVMLAEYVSFILLLFALYVVAGGILVRGNLSGTPLTNTGMLAFGTAIASFVGTTGAAMIMIRPLIRANDQRPYNVHVFVFFIFLVANIGGALSPLGDPPLFVGFLRGVDFFWTTGHLLIETVAVSCLLLVGFFLLDVWFTRREPPDAAPIDTTPPAPFRISGLLNLALIAAIAGATLLSATWDPGIAFDILGTEVTLPNLMRNIVLVGIALLSLYLTPEEHRAANGFTFEPIREVAKLFAAIFVTIIPVLAMLHAGKAGAFEPVINLVTGANGAPDPVAYFWLTGVLSAFLDNAPTYLVFFELAGGDPVRLMGELAHVLAAISMGAVFMGAMTYIGNAPNFMVYAIAVEAGVRMPSFFGFMLWSSAILLPAFVLLSLFFLIA
jgi:Na+/H+ antiporter NhaD/arsenite permease-like protein